MHKATEQVNSRCAASRTDSDTALFFDLINLGELVTKLIGASLAAGLTDDHDRHRYRIHRALVVADGIGDWSRTISDMLTGPASQFLPPGLQQERRELTERCARGTWQHELVTQGLECLRIAGQVCESAPEKVDAQKWFECFSRLRNCTRGHGAHRPSVLREASGPLEAAIASLSANLRLFSRPWAYLHRNLSGKYRISAVCGDQSVFDHLRSSKTESLQDGLYFRADGLIRTDLVFTDVDATDFF